jgi:hypothetical protein
MSSATFLRLLDTPIPEKATRLRSQIADLNAARPTADAFPIDPAAFAAIPGSPFAYWVGNEIREIFEKHVVFQAEGREARIGLSTKDDFRFLRLTWEVSQDTINTRWFPFSKGGPYSPYYYDLHLLLDWENDGERLKKFVDQRAKELFGVGGWSRWINSWDHYFRPGLTWPRRTTSGISIRTLPAGCIFADKGPTAFLEGDNPSDLLAIMAVMNSSPYSMLISLQLGAATAAARSYEVGIIQQTPVPLNLLNERDELANLSLLSYGLARQPFLGEETTHIFCLPALLRVPSPGLAERFTVISQTETERQEALARMQAQIDARVAVLYGVPELLGSGQLTVDSEQSEPIKGTESAEIDDDSSDEATPLLSTHYSLISDLLMWCVGVTFGRWDVRYALSPENLPPLPEPFDPLPVCSPGMLQGTDGLLLAEAPNLYPLAIAPHGFLVDDPDRPADDIVSSVQRVVHLLWDADADAMEIEACQILGVPDLRTWFRDPKGFFAWHIKRYSKSRRKAPIYWLLQSAKKNYAIWLYYPRLNHDSLYLAAREYADAKLSLETTRLTDLQNAVNSLTGAGRKVQERTLAAQAALVEEIKSFRKTLDAAAQLDLQPDLNDGVLLNIGPLHDLIPWNEAERAWNELLKGKYTWSHIANRLREKGIIRGS